MLARIFTPARIIVLQMGGAHGPMGPLYYLILYYIMLCYIILYYIILCYVILYYIISYHIILYYISPLLSADAGCYINYLIELSN